MPNKFSSSNRVIRRSVFLSALVTPMAIVAVSVAPVAAKPVVAAHESTVIEGDGVPYTRPASNEAITTRLELPEGATAHQGKSLPLIVKIFNSGFEDAKELGVFVKTPIGTSIITKTRGWKCGTARTSSGYKCISSRPLGAEKETEIAFTVRSKRTTPPGTGAIKVTPFTSENKKIQSERSNFTIVDLGDAVLIPTVSHLAGKKWNTWTDGRVVSTYTNEKHTYGIWINNEGTENLEKGSTVTLTQKIGSKVIVESAKVSVGSGNCKVVSKAINCSLEADSDIMPLARLAKVEVVVTPTSATDQVALGTITVKNPKDKAKHSTKVNLKSVDRDPTVNINVKHNVVGEVGASTLLSLNLENVTKDLEHKVPAVHAKIPTELVYTKFVGVNWACSIANRLLKCQYGSALTPNQVSKRLYLHFNIASSAKPDANGYTLDFASDNAVQRVNLHVIPAPVLKAEAIPAELETSSNSRANRIQLDADESVENGQALNFKWIQRCTTAADVKEFSQCPSGAPAPKVDITNRYLSRAHAFIPKVTSKKTFLFEVLVQTSTTTQRKTVKVKALPLNTASKASVRKADTSVPEWINTAIKNADVTISEPLLANGVFTAAATLPPSMVSRFKIPTTEKFTLTAPELQSDECIVVHAGETDTRLAIFTLSQANFKSSNFEYIIAPTSCTHGGDTFTGLGLKLDGEVFGQSLTFNGPVTLSPKLNVNLTASSANISIPIGDDSYGFKNAVVNLVADEARQIAKLSFGGFFSIFDTDQFIQGNITVPTDGAGAYSEGMQVSLSPLQPQNFSFDELSLRNMTLSVGVRYTPKLSNVKPLFTVNATGTASFMGVNVDIDQMEVDFLKGRVAAVLFRSRASLSLPGIQTAQASLEYVWKAATPASVSPKIVAAKPASFSVSASAVFVTDSGFAIGTVANPATLEYKSGKCIVMSGQVIIPGFLDATVSGYLITGAPCLAVTIQMGDLPGAPKTILSDVPLPLAPGDWRFDASNVTITLAGYRASGNFTIGKMYGIPYGSLDATLHLTSSSTQNTMYVKGSIDPLRGVTLQGESDLTVAGISAHFKVAAALTSTDQYIGAEADLSIGSTKFLLAGSFGITQAPVENLNPFSRTRTVRGFPTFRFTAAIPKFSIFGYNLGSAQIDMYQSVSSANVSVSTKVDFGVIKFSGEASLHWVDNQIAFSLNESGSVGIANQWSADFSFHMSNCGNSDCTKSGPFAFTASGTAYLAGRAFNLASVSIDSAGHFTVRSSMSGNGCYNTGNIAGLGFEFEGCFDFTFNALISDTAPYASVNADASLRVDYRVRHYPCCKKNYWGRWSRIANFSGGINIQLSPFSMSLSTRLLGFSITFAI